MKVFETPLPGVLLIEPRLFRDSRGVLLEAWQAERYRREAGISLPFVQDTVSRSGAGVLRGLHLQHPRAQGKLVLVLSGAVFDVAVDMRSDSPAFGRWFGATLDADTARQMWVPPGFAHGFKVIGDHAVVLYKCTDVYAPEAEIGVAWDDPDIAIFWPEGAPVLSEKDRRLPRLADIPRHTLPRMADAGRGPVA
ncbi:dTDP-4-dehydrorhamnose 3,5-epimerase [Caenispirillum salinarum AK4]|uniref:dTDP-4-dehydrorhamnose 3,5-epimerase n=1 Tax=Caenispirillum salinarum AK4 TaxID=1238182 RepID=K9GN98_9PROT|nr:dTDP-4-dehydrorhamnose 3,5-epimerase [Caenispirillum salinarum]EKV26124.1 dTDP-4-dehydrorhamnose 3,5-epimerase [Caenispirillum salinarum AK4]